MKQGFFAQHWDDGMGHPAGGVSSGRGFTISWQNGPLGRGADRKDPNGAFVEDIIDAAKGRLEFYEAGEFACKQNKEALHHLEEALRWLNDRTTRREERAVEGTHAV